MEYKWRIIGFYKHDSIKSNSYYPMCLHVTSKNYSIDGNNFGEFVEKKSLFNLKKR